MISCINLLTLLSNILVTMVAWLHGLLPGWGGYAKNFTALDAKTLHRGSRSKSWQNWKIRQLKKITVTPLDACNHLPANQPAPRYGECLNQNLYSLKVNKQLSCPDALPLVCRYSVTWPTDTMEPTLFHGETPPADLENPWQDRLNPPMFLSAGPQDSGPMKMQANFSRAGVPPKSSKSLTIYRNKQTICGGPNSKKPPYQLHLPLFINQPLDDGCSKIAWLVVRYWVTGRTAWQGINAGFRVLIVRYNWFITDCMVLSTHPNMRQWS